MASRPPNSRFLSASIFLAAIFAAVALISSPSRSQSALPNKNSRQYTGPGSCSSPACHGSIGPRTDNRVKQNEYSIWIVSDKHSKAYTMLTGPVGERMAAILGIGKAETSHKCLACHALDVPAEQMAHTFDKTDGVSCENCHGPASAWLGQHTERGWTHAQSVDLGMYDSRDLLKRSKLCLTCHLGDDKPGEEKYVDHEMIAAGHPDLYFELDSFSAYMPRHWKEPGEPGEPDGTSDPWYDVREWTTGQAVQLQQALLHLAARTHGTVWPEYSELECYACHHSLVPATQSWRQARGYTDRRAGDPPWNASRYVIFREIVQQVDEPGMQKLDADLMRLTKLMSTLNPDRSAVAALATSSAQAAGDMAVELNKMSYSPELAMRLLQRISSDADTISNQDEHSAAQAAMALQSLFVAYDRNAKLQNSQELRTAISGLFDQLQIPSSYDATRFSRQMKQVNSLLQ